jgi:hypothetical protein
MFLVVVYLVAEAGASVFIHSYHRVRDRGQAETWHIGHLQQTSAMENTRWSGPLLKQARRYISDLWQRGMLLSRTVCELSTS